VLLPLSLIINWQLASILVVLTIVFTALTTLVVRVDAANARIELDGQLIAQSASGARLRVEPGEHTLSVTAPGRHRYVGRVGVATGATVESTVHLRHDSEPAPPATAVAATPKPEPKKPAPKRNDPDYLVDPFSGNK